MTFGAVLTAYCVLYMFWSPHRMREWSTPRCTVRLATPTVSCSPRRRIKRGTCTITDIGSRSQSLSVKHQALYIRPRLPPLMFGPGANREPVFPSYRGQPPLPATIEFGLGPPRRDYPMFSARLALRNCRGRPRRAIPAVHQIGPPNTAV